MRPSTGRPVSSSTTAAPWHIITGEYPPQVGGVSDYSALVADGLARQGAEVHVWAPSIPASAADDLVGGVAVHRAPDRWTARGLTALDRELDGFPGPRRLLVQYAPNAWGGRGLNVGFVRWLTRRQQAGDSVSTMFHELWYHPAPRDKLIRRLLPPVQKWMARRTARISQHVYVSIIRWIELLGTLATPPVWLPVPSNVPVIDDPAAVAAIRQRVAPEGACIVATFGTFHDVVAAPLLEGYPAVLDAPGTPRVALLLGRGGKAFAERLIERRPDLAGRLIATGGLAPDAASLHLQACDLMLQPYPEGVTTRRGTVMACLSHGRPVVTSLGAISEPIWRESGAVALTPAGDAAALARAALALVADPVARGRLAVRAAELYSDRFSIEQTLNALNATVPPVADSRSLLSSTP